MKGILQRRYSPRKGQGRAEPFSIGEGHGRGEGEESGAASKNSSAYGERNAVKVDDGTREISCGRWSTSTETLGISLTAKVEGTPREKSEEVTVLLRVETTQLGRKEGLLLQPRSARR
jgi:hypothetical protein